MLCSPVLLLTNVGTSERSAKPEVQMGSQINLWHGFLRGSSPRGKFREYGVGFGESYV
jgi:hypothetical protein